MYRPRKNESGFGAIEAILLVVVVIAIVGVGYYVYKARKNTTSTYNTAANASTTTKPVVKPKVSQSSATKYLQITQLGIEIPLSSIISDLNYTWNSTSNGAELGSSTLMKENNQENPSQCQSTDPTTPVSKIVSSTTASSQSIYWMAPDSPGGPTKVISIAGHQYYWYLPGAGSGCSDLSSTYSSQLSAYNSAALSAFDSAVTIK